MMSLETEMIQHAKEVRQRLLFPPNSIRDIGIDLKHKKQPEVEKKIPVDNLPMVKEHPIAHCDVTVVDLALSKAKCLRMHPILMAVSEQYRILIPIIKGKSRLDEHVRPRHVVFYIAYRHTGLSLPALGRMFGCHHTTVLKAYRKIEELVLVDKDLADVIQMLEAKLIADHYGDTDQR